MTHVIDPRPAGGGTLRRWILWLLCSGLLLDGSLRARGLLDNAPLLDARGERSWFGWSHRHANPEELFQTIGGRLRPGEKIVVVSYDHDDAYWWHGMASYFLPDHPVTEVRTPDQGGAALAPGEVRVTLTPRGTVLVSRRRR